MAIRSMLAQKFNLNGYWIYAYVEWCFLLLVHVELAEEHVECDEGAGAQKGDDSGEDEELRVGLEVSGRIHVDDVSFVGIAMDLERWSVVIQSKMDKWLRF